ncbi:MAG: PAC2 family protein, partial [Thermoprotei archaeon]
ELTGYSVHRLMIPSKTNREILLFSGYSSPRNHVYEFCHSILSTAKERWGVKEVVSIGARWSEEPTSPVIEESKVYGFVGSSGDLNLIKKAGVMEHPSEIAPYFANIVVSMAPLYGISAMKLSVDHGEVRPHPKQLKALIQALGRLYDFEADLRSLDEEAEKLKVDVELILKNLRKDGKQEGGQNQMFM